MKNPESQYKIRITIMKMKITKRKWKRKQMIEMKNRKRLETKYKKEINKRKERNYRKEDK